MKELVHFAELYNLDEFDNKPLPVDIFNSEGAILAREGQALPNKRLFNTYVYTEKTSPIAIIEENNTISENDADSVINEIMLDSADLDDLVRIDEEKIESEYLYEEPAGKSYEKESGDPYIMSDEYEEESAITIVERLDNLDFIPLHDIKLQLRKNIHQLKELFRRKIINNVISLDSKNNEEISRNIAVYLDSILDNSIYASDYMDMIHSTRNEDNYLTFSHACSVAFYSLAIVKKLKLLKEDYESGNLGKWLPIQTKKNSRQLGPLFVSNQILRYIDHQKMNIQMKYKSPMKEILFEDLHDIIYEYSKIDPEIRYPSLTIDFESKNREVLTMAALNHDIGKLVISNSIMNKKGRLTREEFKEIIKHPVLSVSRLKESGVDNPAMFAYILGHHRLGPERGYPPVRKMPPPESNVIAIADVYDAMRSPKHHGRGCRQEAALAHLHDLFKEGCFDLPLYVCAVHTFQEYNHKFIKQRLKKAVEEE